MKIVTRFAPSPTGYLHIGGLRTALFNFLYTRHNNGKFLLRIEDTDKKRSDEKYLSSILDGLKWLNINWDEIVHQSEKENRHKEVAKILLSNGLAYELDGAVRLRIPRENKLSFNDLIVGEITVKPDQIEDVVLLRSDGTPTYMLAVVVDDHDMGVTHIIRGADHTMNTFKQKIIYELMGWDLPKFAHIPLIHNSSGAKLSKRDGASNVMDFQSMGILHQAFFNYMLRLGWSHGDKEIFSYDEAMKLFNLESVGKSPACFDLNKLYSLNSHYLNNLPNEEIFTQLIPFLKEKYNFSDEKSEMIKKGIGIFKTRVNTLVELAENLKFYFVDIVPKKLVDKKILTDIKQLLTDNQWQTKEELNFLLKNYSKGKNLKEIYTSLRLVIVGVESSPSIVEIMCSLGRESVLEKMDKQLKY